MATNARIMKKYYEKKARRQGEYRVCLSCSARLSRYNDEATCQKCISEQEKLQREELLKIIGHKPGEAA